MATTWEEFFQSERQSPYWGELMRKIDFDYAQGVCYPPKELLFRAFELCPLSKTKVVIIGQDPYANPGQAMGLAFSVPCGVALPPSLKNIYKEIESEGLGYMNYRDGDLTFLAEQGVLLLNTYLSVKAGQPASCAYREYEQLLRHVLSCLKQQKKPIVFLFWGGFAKKFADFDAEYNHLKLFANHPSPLSANRGGWFGCGHFAQANDHLQSWGETPIDWCNGVFRL